MLSKDVNNLTRKDDNSYLLQTKAVSALFQSPGSSNTALEIVSIDPNCPFLLSLPAQIVCYLGENHMRVQKE